MWTLDNRPVVSKSSSFTLTFHPASLLVLVHLCENHCLTVTLLMLHDALEVGQSKYHLYLHNKIAL